jgi:hypothetical protein
LEVQLVAEVCRLRCELGPARRCDLEYLGQRLDVVLYLSSSSESTKLCRKLVE